MNIVARLWANKHTSAAAMLYVAGKALAEFGAIWFPAHKAQFEASASVLESVAVTYGLLMAGDSAQSEPEKQEKADAKVISSLETK